MNKLYELNNNKELLEEFKKFQLIRSRAGTCKKCSLTYKWSERKDVSDGFTWRCSKCSGFESIRDGSFFTNIRIPLLSFVKLMFHWAIQTKIADIKSVLGISKPTIIKYLKAIRELCISDLNKESLTLGGEGAIVEIDESLFAKVKHFKGKDLIKKQIWVFGLRERNSKKCVFEVVEKRDAAHLLPIIIKYVQPNTIIMSDCWKAYNSLKDHEYIHHQVNHSVHFVDPSSIDKNFKIHTNGIESIWKDAKLCIKRMAGIKRGLIQTYLDEFMWRNLNCDKRIDAFYRLLNVIRKLYPAETIVSKDVDIPNEDVDYPVDASNANDDYDFIVEDENDECDETTTHKQSSTLSHITQLAEDANNKIVEELEKLQIDKNKPKKLNEAELQKQDKDWEEKVLIIIQKLKDSYTFDSNLSSRQRHIVHQLAEKHNLDHVSTGDDDNRVLTISKKQHVYNTRSKSKKS